MIFIDIQVTLSMSRFKRFVISNMDYLLLNLPKRVLNTLFPINYSILNMLLYIFLDFFLNVTYNKEYIF